MPLLEIELEELKLDEVSDDTLEAIAGGLGQSMGPSCPYEQPLTICC